MGIFVGLGLFALASLAAAWAHVRRVRPGLPPSSGPAVAPTTYRRGDRVRIFDAKREIVMDVGVVQGPHALIPDAWWVDCWVGTVAFHEEHLEPAES